jgi:hypothetical protein
MTHSANRFILDALQKNFVHLGVGETMVVATVMNRTERAG